MPPRDDQPLPPPRDPSGPYRICCVCLGNICRSPMAESVLRAKLAEAGLDDRVVVDSAGTGDWHLGQRMHRTASRQLNRRGYDGDSHRARRFDRSWLADRDLVLAMDGANLRDLRSLAGPDDHARIRLFGEVGGLDGAEVPDPYYGGDAAFAEVLAMLEAGMTPLVDRLKDLPEPTP